VSPLIPSFVRTSTPRPALIGIAVFLGTIYPPLWSLNELRVQAPFRYFAADAFYYLAIARNSVGKDIYTYDGVRATNGFNPLWQYYLSAAFARAPSNQEQQLLFVFLSSAVFAALGTALFAVSLYALVRRPVLVLLATLPGFYYLAFSRLDAHFGAPWSFVNGMESGLSILLFGLLSYLLFARNVLAVITAWRLTLVSAVITAIALSRLDDIFLFLPLFALIVIRGSNWPEVARNAAPAASVPLVVIGAYLLYNHHYSGMVLPISAVTKSYGLFHPVAWQNTLKELVSTLIPPRSPASEWTWSGAAWRSFQLTVPVVCSFLWLLHTRRRLGDFRTRIHDMDHVSLVVLLIAVLYVCAKAGYNFFYVHLWDQGHWYFPLNIMIANMLVLLFVDAFISGRRDLSENTQAAFAASGWLSMAAAFAFVIVCGNAFVQLKHYSRYGADFFNFWKERTSISSQLSRLQPAGGILEFDDGIVSYSLTRTTTNGMTLAGDAEELARSRQGEMLDLAHERGIRLIASVWYMQDWPAAAFSDQAAFRAAVQTLAWGQKTDSWKFSLLMHESSPEFHYVILAFEPATAPGLQ